MWKNMKQLSFVVLQHWIINNVWLKDTTKKKKNTTARFDTLEDDINIIHEVRI